MSLALFKNRKFVFAGLVPLVMGSSIAVIYSYHLNRSFYSELQSLENKRDEMNLEWGRLQLEQSTFGTHSRIEELAQQKLGMSVPSANEVKMIAR